MVVVREKTTVTQRVQGYCATHSRTEISVRNVKTVIDEPREREGTNMGPTPTETLVAALIACTNVISHKCANKHGVEIKAMAIEAESIFDRRGTQLLEEIEVPFPKIRLSSMSRRTPVNPTLRRSKPICIASARFPRSSAIRAPSSKRSGT